MDEFFENDRPQETQWVNTVTLDQGLVSAYHSLMYREGYRGFPQMLDFASSGVSQLLPETSTGAPWNEMYNRQFDQNFNLSNNLWKTSYAAITMANTAIQLDTENDGNPFNLRVADSDYKDNYVRQIGEYHFLRAYAYYHLVRNFAPPYNHNGPNTGQFIPFKTKVPMSKGEIFEESLGTTEEIYQQIVADLEIAKQKLPGNFNSATMLPNYVAGRATKYTAAGYLAKVLFVMGKYDQALKETNFIIDAAENQKRFSLEAPIDAFNKNVVSDVAKEAIFEFNTGDPTVSGTSEYVYWAWVFSFQDRNADDFGRGKGMAKSATNQFTLSYWALDKAGWMTDPAKGDYTPTEAAKKDLRYQQLYFYQLPYKAGGDPLIYETVSTHTKVDKPQIYIDKYYRGGPGDGRYTKFPLLRLADIYLVQSWMRWKTGDATGAAADLNKVWNRANPTNPNRYTAANVNHEAILAEYIREMTGEGWTLDFMVGTQMPIPAGDRAGVAPIAPPYSQWKWEVPVEEKNLNPDYQ
ncbi:RagB/SusD family nutrient uptake outer membrane protein [Persicitalea jodogahamensis]|uniref:SusD-like N-terminal domain-containing protein n=1 Tax=Persicitalea jodogahamensis TaxID=402147 RepID=A0A8J3GAJ2_9BACT|nr:RagB/SusD family nutrient uptake outer membrane protein [Persicitalea jodogahamensis]GHB75239.1 hypothetical protein GCM10007390_31220 [Persicitalea jodogahamensis]